MGSIITTKKGLLKLVNGQIEVEVNGSNQPAKDGEQLPKGAVLHIGENATYEITFDDGTKLSNEEVDPASAAVATPVTSEATPDEIQALQDLIASGEDPTTNLPETAAGNAPASDGSSGYVSLARDGSESLATSGYSTSGQTLAAFAPDTPEQSIATDSPSLLANDSITADEDSAATGNVLSNDSDVDNELSVTSFTVNGQTVAAGTTVALEGGSLVINADGSYTFTPNANWNGQVPVITYTTNTGSTATLTINVTPVDDPSVVVNDSNTVDEDSVATGNVLSNDSDVDNELSVTSFTVNGQTVAAGTTVALEGGSLVINADGSYTFTPNANWNGQVPVITYTTNTGSTATLTINVTPVDDASVVVNDTNTVAEDSAATGNVLSNDSDVDNELSVTSFTVNGQTVAAGTTVALEGGSLVINTDGSYTFTPNANWNGQVPVITYTTNTGSTATLTINVTPGNDDFTDASEVISVAEDSGTTPGSVLTGTNSVDGPVTVQSFSIAGQTGPFVLGQAFTIAGVGSFTLNANGNYTFTPVANYNGSVPVITYVLTDGSGPTVTSTLTINVTPVDDPVTLLGLNGTDKTVSEANLATGTQPNNAALTQSGSFNFSTLDGFATLMIAGTTLTLPQLQALSASSPVTITTAYGTLTLTGFSGGASGGSVSYSYTLNTKVDNDSVIGATGTGYIDSISVTVKDIDGNSANNSLDINIVDDVIVLNEGDLNGINAIGTYVGTGLLDTTGADQLYSADLSANVTGWNGTSVTFADSGITSGGNTLFYFVDPLNPSILYAYTDSSGTPSAFDASNINQQLVFTLTAQPNSDSYTMQVYKSIDSLSEVVIAGLNGGEGGNSSAVYVGYNAATGQFDIDSNLSQLAYDLAFTLTSRNANGSAGTVNGNTGGFGANNAFVDSGEVFVIDYAKDVASATINFSGTALVHFKAYDKNGQLLGEGNIASGGEISNLGAISHIELTTTGTGNDFRFQFNGTSAQEIVTSTQGTNLNFDVTVKDSDGDTANGNFDVNLAAPGGIPLAPLALTVNSTARLQEADLLTNGLDSDSQALTFKAGSDAIGVFQFGDVSGIQVSGINANISWALNELGQLIGTTMGREAFRLTLDWDRINAGEQGNVTVKAELLTTLPHSVNVDNLTISGIKVIGVTGTGQTAVSNVTVTVTDDVPDANDDTGSVNVIVDSFRVSGVEANWKSWTNGTSVTTFDGNNNPNGGGTDNDSGLDQIRWGNPINTYKSGYGFIDNDSALNGQFALNQDIILGTFTHYNFPISSGGAITKATMDVTFSVTDAYGVVTPVTLKVNFDHTETPNNDNDPEASKDIIKVGNTNVTFEHQGQVYTLQVIGFRVPGTNQVVTEIKTAENAANSYELVVRIVAGDGYELPSTEGNVLTNDVIGADNDLTVVGAAAGNQTGSGTTGNIGTIINGQYGTLILFADGSYTYTVTANASAIPAGATETFTYTMQDADGDQSSALLTINVNTVNANALKAVQDEKSGPEDTAVIGNVLENDGNKNTSVSHFTVANDTTQHTAGSKITLAEGELTLNANGSYTFTPAADWNGQVPVITYTTNTGATSTLTIVVTPVNDPTVTKPDNKTVAEDTLAKGYVLENDTDVDNTLSVTSFQVNGVTYNAGNTWYQLPEGSLQLKANGEYSFDPKDHWSGSLPEITYTTNTGATNTLNITVQAVADAPNLIINGYTSVAAINFEDAKFSGSWDGIKANDIKGLNTIGTWHTSNAGGKIEVGQEKTYLGGNSNNKVMEIEFNNGDKTLYTDMRLEAGRFYELGFDIAARMNSAATSGLTIKLVPLDANGNPIMAQAVMLYDFNPTTSGWLKDQKVTLPVGTSGNYRLLFEADNADSVGAIMDNLAFRAVDNMGYNGSFIKLGNISANLVDTDGSESLSIKLQGLPVGSVLTDGEKTLTIGADGTADISSWNKSNLLLKPVTTGTINITVVATATESSNSDKATTTTTFPVTVLPATVVTGGQSVDSFIMTNWTGESAQFAVSLSGYGSVGAVASTQYIDKSTELLINAGASNDYVELGISTANNVINTGSSLPNSNNSVVTQAEILASNFMTQDSITTDVGSLKSNVLQPLQPKTDTVNLGSGDDTVNGGEGSQVVHGGGGNDLLIGGVGIDGLRGGDGNDTLIGGLGDDVLRGDGGNDTFVWRYADADNGTDHIMDFKVGEDKLDLSDLLQGETANTLESYLNFSLNNGSTVIDIDANRDGTFDQHIVLDGVNLYSQYGATDNAGIINGLLGSNGQGPLIIDTQPAPVDLEVKLDPLRSIEP